MKLEKICELLNYVNTDETVLMESIKEHLGNTYLKLEEIRMHLVHLESLDTPDKHEELLNELGRLEDLLYEI